MQNSSILYFSFPLFHLSFNISSIVTFLANGIHHLIFHSLCILWNQVPNFSLIVGPSKIVMKIFYFLFFKSNFPKGFRLGLSLGKTIISQLDNVSLSNISHAQGMVKKHWLWCIWKVMFYEKCQIVLFGEGGNVVRVRYIPKQHYFLKVIITFPIQLGWGMVPSCRSLSNHSLVELFGENYPYSFTNGNQIWQKDMWL
jgi:hypothetical protein